MTTAQPTNPTSAKPAQIRKRLWLALAGVVVLVAILVLADVVHQHQVQVRTDGMNEAYAIYQQSSPHATPQSGALAVGAGELVFKLCQARESGYQTAVAMGRSDATAAGYENAVQMAQAVTGINDRSTAERVVSSAVKAC
jgi:hypothetical protein